MVNVLKFGTVVACHKSLDEQCSVITGVGGGPVFLDRGSNLQSGFNFVNFTLLFINFS